MKNRIFFIVAGLLLIFGGTSTGETVDSTYSFIETDFAGQRVRVLELALTNQKGSACIGGIGGEWKRVRVVSDPDKYTRDPVYSLGDGKLEVLLINGICDAYDSYVGEISDGVFVGNHVQYGWGSKTIGKVRGRLSKK